MATEQQLLDLCSEIKIAANHVANVKAALELRKTSMLSVEFEIINQVTNDPSLKNDASRKAATMRMQLEWDAYRDAQTDLENSLHSLRIAEAEHQFLRDKLRVLTMTVERI